MMSQLNQKYSDLAAKLGDIQYKIEKLERDKAEIVAEIAILDAAVGLLKQIQPKEKQSEPSKAKNTENPKA